MYINGFKKDSKRYDFGEPTELGVLALRPGVCEGGYDCPGI